MAAWIVTAVLAAVVIICLFAGIRTNLRETSNTYDTASDELTESITVELKEYFGQYLTNQKGEIRELNNTLDSLQNNSGYIELTQAQQDMLIAKIIENLTPEMLKNIMHSDTSISQETIENLEQSIYEQLVENFSSYYENAELTDAQKQAVADAVTVIVETNILSILEEKFEQQKQYLVSIEEAIEEKLQKMTDTVTSYQETVKEIETKLKVVEKNSSNTEEVERLRTQLEMLQKSYESFVATAQPAINIVSNLSVYPTGSNDVLSAQAGYNLNQKIMSVNDALSSSFTEFSDAITAKVDANDRKQSQKLSDAKTDLESQIADNAKQVELLDQARKAAEKALETKAEEDIAALKDALAKLDGNLSSDLQAAYDLLVQADSGNKDAMDRALSSAKDSINADIQAANNNITSLRTDLNETSDRLSKEIQQMGDDVNNNIVAKLPTYEWSEGGKRITITIPAQ